MAEEKKAHEKEAAEPRATKPEAAPVSEAPAPAPAVAVDPTAISSTLTDAEAQAAAQAAAKATPKHARGKGARHVPFGIVHVRASFNNTTVAVCDPKGNVIGWSSAGRAGFKGARKSTAFAASMVGQEAARQALLAGVREVEVRVQGPGAGRETAIRALQSAGLSISVIKDVTPVPHNGCRPRKRRRV
jgi:small subunit ribosomal protein S11